MKDVIIILGGGINRDGSLPDLPKKRVEAGIELFKERHAQRIIMSGKYGFWLDESGVIPSRSEAEAMKEYAVALGIPADSILLEEESKDTLGNAYFTKVNFLEKNNWKKVVIVTSDFHFERTKYIFNLVLGHDYSIDYVLSETGVLQEKQIELVEQEKKTIQALKEIIGTSVRTGDTKAIQNILLTKHPGYSKNPEFAFSKLREILGRD